MQSLKKFYFGKQKAKVNTYVGGVGAVINTPQKVATGLGVPLNRIKLFSVIGNDIQFSIIGGQYTITAYGMGQTSANPMTYFRDPEGLVVELNDAGNFFDNNSGKIAMTELELPGLKKLPGEFDRKSPIKKYIFPKLEAIPDKMLADPPSGKETFVYAPLATTCGSSPTADNNCFNKWWGNIKYKLLLNPAIQTCNAGNPDPDVVGLFAGSTVTYVTNFTPPNTITNLSSGTIYNTAIQLNFTPPSSTNGVDFYEVYISGEKFSSKEIKNSGELITGLLPNTAYKIEVKAVDMFYNKSAFSNAVNVTTTNRVATDIDAVAYVDASANTLYQDIIDDMYTGLKTQGLYTKLQAFYPFLGTTQAQHKWNGKNPQDTNAAFRLQFFGGGTHSNLGYQCNGTNAYANTFLAPSAVQNVNSNGLTVTVGTNNNVVGSYALEIGSQLNGFSGSLLTSKVSGSSGGIVCDLNSQANRLSILNTSSIGIYTGVKQASTTHKVFRNKINSGSGTGGGALTSLPIFIGALNFDSSANGHSNQRIQFTAIHEGLTDAEVVALHTIIDNFETAIGRKTW